MEEPQPMKITYKSYNAVAAWRWTVKPEEQRKKMDEEGDEAMADGSGSEEEANGNEDDDEEDEEDDACGICQLEFESACPQCKVPGDDCPLIWGECTHVFHMHCLLKWLQTPSSREQCPLDRRPWATADRAIPDASTTDATTTNQQAAATSA